MENTLSYKR
ncbi:hypothetical protein LINGRAHAP2_LOCUS11054 [Linum grandiflorum]